MTRLLQKKREEKIRAFLTREMDHFSQIEWLAYQAGTFYYSVVQDTGEPALLKVDNHNAVYLKNHVFPEFRAFTTVQ